MHFSSLYNLWCRRSAGGHAYVRVRGHIHHLYTRGASGELMLDAGPDDGTIHE